MSNGVGSSSSLTCTHRIGLEAPRARHKPQIQAGDPQEVADGERHGPDCTVCTTVRLPGVPHADGHPASCCGGVRASAGMWRRSVQRPSDLSPRRPPTRAPPSRRLACPRTAMAGPGAITPGRDDMDIPQERRAGHRDPGPPSQALWSGGQAAVPEGSSTPPRLRRGAPPGAIVEDVDGNRLIDLGAGLAVLNVGNSAPAVVQAVREQLEPVHAHVPARGHDRAVYRARGTAQRARVPATGLAKTMFVNSGAEAVENAVKIARYHTGATGVVVFDHAFHGRTLLAMTMTAKVMPYKQGFGPLRPGGLPAARSPIRIAARPAEPRPRNARTMRRVRHRPDGQAHRRRTTSPAWSWSRSRARVGSWSRHRASSSPEPILRATRASSSWPTRSRPGSAGRADGSPSSTRASCPT